MNLFSRFSLLSAACFLLLAFNSCKKDTFITDESVKLEFSQDSILFDTVFTSIGSSTRNFRIRNTHKQKIKISSIVLQGGASSYFKVNVDGTSGTSFQDLELAANDSMYIFVQVKIDPANASTPFIVSDQLIFNVNGNEQKMPLEAWGQDAYYHYPDSAVKFQDGSYFPYSLVNANPGSYNFTGGEYVWKNDKPHVVYGYLVIDEKQKMRIPAGTSVYMNYKAGLWVFAGGQLQVLGQKGKEVIFQGARREKEFADEPGQWDRIWINEGSDQNIIDYAVIKNGYIGVQAELLGDNAELAKKRLLRITNSKIQNMSLWGLYGLAYQIIALNNVISNCQEYSVNILLGGGYYFAHNTIANYWKKQKLRDKPAVNLNNHSKETVYPLYFYMGNSVVDGRLENEFNLDLTQDVTYPYTYTVSNCYLKTNLSTTNTTHYYNNKNASSSEPLKYKDADTYDFSPATEEKRIGGFVHPFATQDALNVGTDVNGKTRNTSTVTAGAYELP